LLAKEVRQVDHFICNL